MWFFPGGTYHSQLRSGSDSGNYDGEYRGFYPSGNAWRPKSSHYLGRVGSHPHRGVDVYAPYAVHPLETPVCAVVDGTLYCRDALTEPQQLGNRAELKFGDNFEKTFSYGHLSRFEGRDGRKVKAGEVIGYSGCSGNADTLGECSKCGVCNINSGHVHLSVRGPANMDRNPLTHCNLRLRFGVGDPLLKEQKCSDWIHPETGSGLREKWKPDLPLPGKLQGKSQLNWRRVEANRAPLKKPFTTLEFDAPAELETTRSFYAMGVKRLAKNAAMADTPKSEDDKELKRLLKRVRDSAVVELRANGAMRLENLRKQLVDAHGEVLGLQPLDDATRVPGWLLRHLAVLSQMCWVVFGGAALDRLADNDGGTADKPQYGPLKQIDMHNPTAPHKDMNARYLPQCGAGMGGTAWMSASSDTARNAVHYTNLGAELVAGEKRPYWITSVTFGAGSLMHATISELMAYPTYGGAAADPTHDQAIAEYIETVGAAAAELWATHAIAHTHQVALSNELGNGAVADTKRAFALELMRDAILSAADAFITSNALIGSDDLAGALLLRLVQSNSKLFADLIAKQKEVEAKEPLGPAFFMLQTVEAQ